MQVCQDLQDWYAKGMVHQQRSRYALIYQVVKVALLLFAVPVSIVSLGCYDLLVSTCIANACLCACMCACLCDSDSDPDSEDDRDNDSKCGSNTRATR